MDAVTIAALNAALFGSGGQNGYNTNPDLSGTVRNQQDLNVYDTSGSQPLPPAVEESVLQDQQQTQQVQQTQQQGAPMAESISPFMAYGADPVASGTSDLGPLNSQYFPFGTGLGTPSNFSNAGQVYVEGGTNPYLTESKQNVGNLRDPFAQFLSTMIGQQLDDANMAKVPEFVRQAIASQTADPGVAPRNFGDISGGILAGLRPQEKQEQADLKDLFRKAGGVSDTPMQSGAFAQGARDLLRDQDIRRGDQLAAQYVPLTAQSGANQATAISQGLNLAEANSILPRTTLGLYPTIKPIATQTENVAVGSSVGATPASTAPSTFLQGAGPSGAALRDLANVSDNTNYDAINAANAAERAAREKAAAEYYGTF